MLPSEVWSDDVLSTWKLVPSGPEFEQLRWRTKTLSGSSERKWKETWHRYLSAADKAGILSTENLHRLRTANDDIFYQALNECMACWYFQDVLGFETSSGQGLGAPGRNPDLLVSKAGISLVADVKSPIRATKSDMWCGDDSIVLGRQLGSALEQFSAERQNIVVLTPRVRVLATWDRQQLVKALFYTNTYSGTYDAARGEITEVHPSIRMDGRLLRDDDGENKYGKISAVVCLEAYEVDEIKHSMLVLHNPRANKPLPQDLFGGSVQLIWSGNVPRWTDRPVGDS